MDIGEISGSFYEMSVRYPHGSDEELLLAARHLWRDVDLDGPLRRVSDGQRSTRWASIEPEDIIVDRDLLSGHGPGSGLRGRAALPVGTCPCVMQAIRDPLGGDAADWLNLSVGTDQLGQLVSLSWPPGGKGNGVWREPVDAWFGNLATRLRASVPFEIALIGEEVSGSDDLLHWHLAHGRCPVSYVTSDGYTPAEY